MVIYAYRRSCSIDFSWMWTLRFWDAISLDKCDWGRTKRKQVTVGIYLVRVNQEERERKTVHGAENGEVYRGVSIVVSTR